MKAGKFISYFLSALLVVGLVTASAEKQKLSKNRDLTLKAGEHVGEIKQLDVDITFSGQYGQTVTDENGTYYHVWGYTFYENKVYTPEYWGVFPLYFFGTRVGVSVRVTNLGPRKTAKLRVRNEVYCLNTDGSSGVELETPSETDVVIENGKSVVVDASFVGQQVEGAESGLDRILIKILHPNNGGGPGNPDPALIMVKEGIFCPPENEGEILNILEQILGQ